MCNDRQYGSGTGTCFTSQFNATHSCQTSKVLVQWDGQNTAVSLDHVITLIPHSEDIHHLTGLGSKIKKCILDISRPQMPILLSHQTALTGKQATSADIVDSPAHHPGKWFGG